MTTFRAVLDLILAAAFTVALIIPTATQPAPYGGWVGFDHRLGVREAK